MSLVKRVSMLRKSLLMESSSNLVYLMISKGVHMMRSTVTMNYVRMDAIYLRKYSWWAWDRVRGSSDNLRSNSVFPISYLFTFLRFLSHYLLSLISILYSHSERSILSFFSESTSPYLNAYNKTILINAFTVLKLGWKPSSDINFTPSESSDRQ